MPSPRKQLTDVKLETLELFARNLGLVQNHPDYSGGRPATRRPTRGPQAILRVTCPRCRPSCSLKEPLRPVAVQ